MTIKQQYYSLPLCLEPVMQLKDHPKTTLRQSVAQYLHLVITTAFGELPADEKFGCSIWELDFDIVTSRHTVKELIKQSLLSSIVQYEKRLTNVRVNLMMSQEEGPDGVCQLRVRKKISVFVSGTLHATNESFAYTDEFFTAPLSYQLI